MKFKYFKRVVGGKVLDLHIHEYKGDFVSSKVFPEHFVDEYFQIEHFEELDNVNSWLDEGLKQGIFNSTPIPEGRSI